VSGTVATPIELRRPEGAQLPDRRGRSFRDAAAAFWLDVLFRAAGSPRLTRAIKPIALGCAYRFSRAIRYSTAANAKRIFGPDLTPDRQEQFTRGVLSSFYDFVCDVGQCLHLSREQLAARIDSAEGEQHYLAARAAGKGTIIATAHMGSFEAGAAALLDREHAMHVVFKRDPTRFEQVRSSLRKRLGVIEAPVDDGWMLWLRLREALMRGEVVMLQADRVMPGQKGCRVPFLHGHLLLPTSPIKLALASGAPIVPIFALRNPDGRIRIQIEPAITVEPSEAEPHPALLRFAAVLEKYVRAYPEQWLLFHPAFCEDAG
jgi:KDO2-lipid IV(A) lauroyltransferase